MINGILIDIDNTLYDYAIAHQSAVQAVESFLRELPHGDLVLSAIEPARAQIHESLQNTAASHNRLLYFQRAVEMTNVVPLSCAMALYNVYWNAFLEHMQLGVGVEEFLKTYRDKKLCFLTDLTALIQYRKLQHLGILEYVRMLVTSEEAGVEKPHHRIFELGLHKMELPAQEVCMIGDNYSKDIEGALALGITPYWKHQGACADSRVITFSSFKELIGKI